LATAHDAFALMKYDVPTIPFWLPPRCAAVLMAAFGMQGARRTRMPPRYRALVRVVAACSIRKGSDDDQSQWNDTAMASRDRDRAGEPAGARVSAGGHGARCNPCRRR